MGTISFECGCCAGYGCTCLTSLDVTIQDAANDIWSYCNHCTSYNTTKNIPSGTPPGGYSGDCTGAETVWPILGCSGDGTSGDVKVFWLVDCNMVGAPDPAKPHRLTVIVVDTTQAPPTTNSFHYDFANTYEINNVSMVIDTYSNRCFNDDTDPIITVLAKAYYL